ncbi:MAG TPA: cohesin domain-containing protein [Thermoanaerobaculia bacterium]|nr:cohesin domain-containing protein [Thermoanaerobaculia bacterium]
MKPRRCVLRSLRPLFLLGLGLLGGVVGACGGGGGGGGTPTQPPPPPPPTQASIAFTPAAAAGAGSLSLARGAASTTTKLVLEVRSGGIQDLYGVAFDLQYPANLLQLTATTNQGSILSTGTFQETHTSGNVVVGVSQLGLVPGVSSAGVVFQLEFTPLASGTGLFSFTRNSALNSSGASIGGVTWIAGSVTTVVP